MEDGAAAVQEALRRRAGLGASTAGLPGGAPAANANTPANPLASAGVTPTTQASQGTMPPAPTAQNPLAGAQSMLSGSKPGEAEIILKSFADRLKKIPIAGQPALMMP